MNKKNIPVVFSICFFLVFSALSARAMKTGQQTVLVTTFPIYQIVRNVVQDRQGVQVKPMLPSQIGYPHDYALTPQDIQKAARPTFWSSMAWAWKNFLARQSKRPIPRLLLSTVPPVSEKFCNTAKCAAMTSTSTDITAASTAPTRTCLPVHAWLPAWL